MHQSVEVPEYSGIVAVTTEDISGLVGERQVKDLPLNGRSYDQLLTLNPGIVNYTSQRSGSIGTSNSVLGSMFAVSGAARKKISFSLMMLNSRELPRSTTTPGGASGQLLGVDAVREFAVVKDTYGAEYGKRPGAQSASSRPVEPTSSTAALTSFYATARWTRETAEWPDRNNILASSALLRRNS